MALNPFQIVQLNKQVVNDYNPKSYGTILSETMRSNPIRLFTLGLFPSLFRNVTLAAGFAPSFMGFNYGPLQLLFACGAVLISHPFEVARVLVQYHDKSSMFGKSMKTLRGLYATDGVAGLYRGVVPRMIHVVPTFGIIEFMNRMTRQNE